MVTQMENLVLLQQNLLYSNNLFYQGRQAQSRLLTTDGLMLLLLFLVGICTMRRLVVQVKGMMLVQIMLFAAERMHLSHNLLLLREG